ncbi:MAG: hypothetical protein A3G41_00245 [Elusimicrobia bacterium RIFCSPLOWO2_12_FULL_59_9]|nr:MAG: hypothetical protein A3G41_00245 [Elusimicrobia bacterium RIFCSPLOWO2_12_FULL_59_9]
MIMSNELFFLIGGTVFVLYIVFMAIWLHGPIGHEKQRQLQLTQIWNKVRALVEKREADPQVIGLIQQFSELEVKREELRIKESGFLTKWLASETSAKSTPR